MTRYNVFWQRRLWHLLLILVAILISFSRARQMRVCLFVAWVLSQLAFRVLLVSGEQALGYSDRRHGVNNLSRLPGSYLPNNKPTLRAALTTVIINTDASVVERHTSGRLLERERCRKRRRRPEGAAATASVTANSSNDNHYIIAADATTTTATVATFLA